MAPKQKASRPVELTKILEGYEDDGKPKGVLEEVLQFLPPALTYGLEEPVVDDKFERKARVMQLLNNEEAVLKVIEYDPQFLKFVKELKPGMLTPLFCLKEYRANLAEQDETLTFVPPWYWHDLEFCLIMMVESPACLKLMPILNGSIARRIHSTV